MVEHRNSIKIEFILQRIKEIFIRDFPVERVFREILHYEVIYWTYCQQKNSPFEFINLQSAFDNLVVDLYDLLQLKDDRQKIDEGCMEIFLKHCQQVEKTFSLRDAETIQTIITKYSFWEEKNINTEKLLENIRKVSNLYNSWSKQQEELRENKLLLQENTIDWELEINQLLATEIKQVRATISQMETKIAEILNNFYMLVSPLSKIFPIYCSRSIFLEIVQEPTDNDLNRVFAELMLHKYLKKIAQENWTITDCNNDYLLELKGNFIYNKLYPEIGIHRVSKQQLELFAEGLEEWRNRDLPRSGALKTFSVRVNVIPQPSLSEIPQINCQDIKIKSVALNPGCGVRFYSFTMLHKPTKITATICDRNLSMHLTMKLLTLLTAKIYSDFLKPKPKTIEENLLSEDFDGFRNAKLNVEKIYYGRRYGRKF